MNSRQFSYVVLIATDKCHDHLLHLIEQIRRQSDIDICISVNGPHSGQEADVLKEQTIGQNVKVISILEKGKSVALNKALEIIGREDLFVIYADDDIEINPNWIENYISAVEANGRDFYYGSAFYVAYDELPDKLILRKLPPSAKGIRDEELDGYGYFLGFNWGAFANDVIAVGGFDPHYGPGSTTNATGQETNMMRRLEGRGVKRKIVLNNYVLHTVPVEKSSWEWILLRAYRNGLSRGLTHGGNLIKLIPRFYFYSLLAFSGSRRAKIRTRALEGKIEGARMKSRQEV